jgi:hypothetical protein
LGSGDNPLDNAQAFGFASRELLNEKERELLLANALVLIKWDGERTAPSEPRN